MRTWRAAIGVVAGVALAAAALTGCAPASIHADTSQALQQNVVTIADAAASGDVATALAEVDRLQQQVTAGIADGSVSAADGERIQAALDQVRADLLALVPATEDEATTDSEPTTETDTTSDPEPTTPEPAATPETEAPADPVVEDTPPTGPGNSNGKDKDDKVKGKD
jgi:hypothetical protein